MHDGASLPGEVYHGKYESGIPAGQERELRELLLYISSGAFLRTSQVALDLWETANTTPKGQ